MIVPKIRTALISHPQRSLQSLAPPANTCTPVLLAVVVTVTVERPLPAAAVTVTIINVALELLEDHRAELVTTTEAVSDEIGGASFVKPDVPGLTLVSMDVIAVGVSSIASLVAVGAKPGDMTAVMLGSGTKTWDPCVAGTLGSLDVLAMAILFGSSLRTWLAIVVARIATGVW